MASVRILLYTTKIPRGPEPKTLGAVRPPSLPPPIPQKQPHHFLPHIHLHPHNPRLQPSPHRAPYIGTPPQTCNKTLIHDGPPPRKKKGTFFNAALALGPSRFLRRPHLPSPSAPPLPPHGNLHPSRTAQLPRAMCNTVKSPSLD
jgi:hypothetical protein